MPWETPTLEGLRKQNRDAITARLASGAMVPNSVLRVMSDANAGLAYHVMLYLDWLSRQFLPDTAEAEWLRNRHAKIWLGGWKQATFAEGVAVFTGDPGVMVPEGTMLIAGASTGQIEFETTTAVRMSGAEVPAPIRALTAGKVGNLDDRTTVALAAAISGVDGSAYVMALGGGADEESDEDLRARVLERIRNPPMGGDAEDYVAWALAVPGVTRAWSSPLEMGMGTVTVRVMCDDLRGADGGIPHSEDIVRVREKLDKERPVAVKDFFVVAPVPHPVSFTISNLVPDTAATRAAIAYSVRTMIRENAAPGHAINGVAVPAQTIFAAWISRAILDAPGVESFDLTASDAVMPHNGALAVLGTIFYA